MKHKITDLDTDQCARYVYDESHQANRVIITGSDFGLKEAIVDALKDFKPTITYEQPQILTGVLPSPVIERTAPPPEIIYIDKPFIVEKIVTQDVEKYVIVKEIEYREVEKPIIVREKEYITIESSSKQEQSKDNKLEYIKLILMAAMVVALLLKK